MGYFYGMRNIWLVDHIYGDDLSSSGAGGLSDVRTQLHQE
jgi:hypothetical protein